MGDGTRYLPERCVLCNETVSDIYANVRRDMPCAKCGYYLLQAAELLALVRKAVAEQFGIDPERLTVEFSLYKALGSDSLDLVELVMHLEDIIPPELNAERLGVSETQFDSLNEVTIGNVVRSFCRRASADA